VLDQLSLKKSCGLLLYLHLRLYLFFSEGFMPHLFLPVKSILDLFMTLLKARRFIRNFLGVGTLVRDNA